MIDSLKTHIKNGEVDKVMALISSHPEVLDQKDENGSSGLLIIAYSGLGKAFEMAKAVKKSFTFHESIICGKTENVKAIVAQDKQMVNTYSEDGFTPLSLAAFFDQTTIAKLLLENGADPNLFAKNPSKVNALHSAVAKENYELVKLMIDYGANVNSTQMQNVTPLHAAAHRGNLSLIELLVSKGANIDAKMDNGDTAIDIAAKDGHEAVRTYLEDELKNKKAS